MIMEFLKRLQHTFIAFAFAGGYMYFAKVTPERMIVLSITAAICNWILRKAIELLRLKL